MSRTEIDQQLLWKNLSDVAANVWNLDDAAADEFAFHMTDWIDDLERLVRLFGLKERDRERGG